MNAQQALRLVNRLQELGLLADLAEEGLNPTPPIAAARVPLAPPPTPTAVTQPASAPSVARVAPYQPPASTIVPRGVASLPGTSRSLNGTNARSTNDGRMAAAHRNLQSRRYPPVLPPRRRSSAQHPPPLGHAAGAVVRQEFIDLDILLYPCPVSLLLVGYNFSIVY